MGWLYQIASDGLKGRVFEVSLADLQQDEDQAFRKIKLRAEDVQGKNVLTNFWVSLIAILTVAVATLAVRISNRAAWVKRMCSKDSDFEFLINFCCHLENCLIRS